MFRVERSDWWDIYYGNICIRSFPNKAEAEDFLDELERQNPCIQCGCVLPYGSNNVCDDCVPYPNDLPDSKPSDNGFKFGTWISRFFRRLKREAAAPPERELLEDDVPVPGSGSGAVGVGLDSVEEQAFDREMFPS